jgi:predicted ATPase
MFAKATAGQRQLVFVTGEAGIGKTTLVEAFLASIGDGGGVRIGRGQCVEQFGAGEAYLPVLEALGRLGRETGGERLVATLRQHAPAWLAHLPGLLSDEDLVAVERRAQATTRDRTLRELIEAFDVLGAEAPLVLVLEDLHWSDSATIELLGMLARRRDSARLFILATYRPADVAAAIHPLRAVVQELQLHGRCEQILLDFLAEDAIGDYLAGRFPTAAFPPRFARLLGRNTSGNPLFLVNVVDDLIAHGDLREVDGRWHLAVPVEDLNATVPHTLRQMVEKQIDRLTPQERAVLAVASVAGVEFSAELAASDGVAPRIAEECCDTLAREGRFLRPIGAAEWPDGTVAARYGFIHALYQNVLYERVPLGSRVGLHLRIGTRLERAHGARATEIAGELAMHFERGRDFERAIHYRRSAAEAALRRHAHREAADHAKRALELCGGVPESSARIRQELAIQMVLGAALLGEGWAVPEVERTFVRARELCTRVGDAPERFAILSGLFGFYVSRAELGVARDLAKEMLEIASASEDAAVRLAAHHDAGMVAFYRGDLGAALEHLERALALYDPVQHRPNCSAAFRGGQDVGVTSELHAAWVVWLQGYPERSATRMLAALARARTLDHPYTIAFANYFTASVYQCRGDVERVRELEEAAIARATEDDIEITRTLAAVCRGWLLSEDGRRAGVEEMRSGIAAYRSHGNEFGVPTFLALLAEAYGKAAQPREGLAVVAEALDVAERSGAHYWDAELTRLEGALLLECRTAPAAERKAEACFLSAIDVAQRQGANLLALRATTSLARLWHQRGSAEKARAALSQSYASFSEGFATRDLCDARELLDVLDREGETEIPRRPTRSH